MWTQIINYHKGVNEFSELIPGKDPTKYKTHFFQEEEEGEYVVFPHHSCSSAISVFIPVQLHSFIWAFLGSLKPNVSKTDPENEDKIFKQFLMLYEIKS